jgi:hypothetical protein
MGARIVAAFQTLDITAFGAFPVTWANAKSRPENLLQPKRKNL